MTERDVGPLDDDLRALLQAESERPEVEGSVKDRVHERVLRTIALTGGDPGGDGGSGAAGSSSGAASAGSAGAGASAGAASVATTGLGSVLTNPVVIGVLSFVVGGFSGAAVQSSLQASPEPEVRIVEVPAPAPSSSEPAAVEASEPVPQIENVDESSPESPAPAAAPRPASGELPRPGPAEVAAAPVAASSPDASLGNSEEDDPAEATRDEDLATENALIDRATTALARGRPAQALDALREHATRFPRGQQVQEREALWIQTLVRIGRHDEARARGERFRARWPRSPLRRAVDATLESVQ